MQDTPTDPLEYNDFEDEEIVPEEVIPPPEEDPEAEESTLAQKQQEYNEINQASYQKLFHSLVLSVFDMEKALDVSQKAFTDILVERGIEADPASLYNRINSIQDRVIHIMIAKNLAMANGLSGEWDSILQRELNLIYGDPRVNRPVNVAAPEKATGEKE